MGDTLIYFVVLSLQDSVGGLVSWAIITTVLVEQHAVAVTVVVVGWRRSISWAGITALFATA